MGSLTRYRLGNWLRLSGRCSFGLSHFWGWDIVDFLFESLESLSETLSDLR
jgi:hypothetical protein